MVFASFVISSFVLLLYVDDFRHARHFFLQMPLDAHLQRHRGRGAAVARALERHKKLGESVVVWKDGKVVMLKPSQIPLRPRRQYK